MSDWPRREDRWGLDWSLSWAHPLSLGAGAVLLTSTSLPATTAWPAADRAILIPFRLPELATAYKITIGAGATASGNFDVGIYDIGGNRLVSSGTQSKGSNTEHNVDITDTVLGRGTYYMAFAADGTNNYIAQAPNLYFLKALGVRQASSAFVLPATVTFETVASAFLPSINVRLRSH